MAGCTNLTSSTFILTGLVFLFSVPPATPSDPHSNSLSQGQHTPSARPRTSGEQINRSGQTVSTCHQTLSGAMFWALPTVHLKAGGSQHIPG